MSLFIAHSSFCGLGFVQKIVTRPFVNAVVCLDRHDAAVESADQLWPGLHYGLNGQTLDVEESCETSKP